MVHVVSFDPATKSLAISIVYYNLNIESDIQTLYTAYLKQKNSTTYNNANINTLLLAYAALLDAVQVLLQNRIKIIKLSVVDLIPDCTLAQSTALQRSTALHNYLHNVLDIDLLGRDCIFLLEFQMGPNIKSGTIASQIMYHLIKYKCDVQLVGPALKNKVIIGGAASAYAEFIKRYSTNYACNKAHAKHNLYELLRYLNATHTIAHICKKNHDDIADAVLIGLSYVLKNY